jgi:hypothetical protein
VSLYRQPGRVATRTLAVVGVAALVVGAAIGFAVGRSTKSEPSLRSQVADVRAAIAPARDGLELVQTEYAQAVRGGKVVAQTEYAAAKADVQRARDAVAKHGADLAALDPAGTALLRQRLAALAQAVDAKADATEFAARARAAQRALDAVAGAPAG